MKKITFLKTALLAVAMMVGSVGVMGQTESIIYSTGFETSDGFTHGTTYNNTTVEYTGATGKQWGTFYGTPSTTSPITPSQSMQMRWYTPTPDDKGYTFTDFDLPKATKVTFKAKNSNGINVIASYSTDGGTTYTGNQTFTLSTTPAEYTYNISSTGEFDNVRIKFALTYTTAPTATSRLYIDDVQVYGMISAATAAAPTFNPPAGAYNAPQNVELASTTTNAKIYYTTDGSEPDNATGTLYTGAIPVSTATTIKAIAYDASNANPSLVVVANYAITSGAGTESSPYTVDDVKKINNILSTQHWVKGYIVGTASAGDGVNLTDVALTSPFLATNIVLADAANETDLTKMIAVQLPSGAVRTALNLVDNPANLNKSVKVYGNLQGYFSGTPGVTNTSDYKLDFTSGVFSVKSNANAWTSNGQIHLQATIGETIEVFNIAGQKIFNGLAKDGLNRISVDAKGVVIVKVHNRVSKVIL